MNRHAVLAAIALALVACSAPVERAPAPAAGDAGETPTSDPAARTYRVVAVATGGDCPARLEGAWAGPPAPAGEEDRIMVGGYRLMAELTWSSPDAAEGRAGVRAPDCEGDYAVTVAAIAR